MAMNGTPKLRNAILGCSFGCFLVSLCLPAIQFANHAPVFGFTVLFWGWWGFLSANFAWLANIFFLAAIAGFKYKKYLFAAITSFIALGLGLSSFHAKAWWFNEGSGTPISGLGPAYYFWMLGFLILFVGSLVLPRQKRMPHPDSQ